MNDIAVVICNYNKKEYVKGCVESLLKQTTCTFDIFVVDNASTDGSADEIRKLYGDKVTLICNKENLGGSGGFNTGIKRAMEGREYSYIVLLDNDVVLREDCIENMMRCLADNPKIGILGAKILKMDQPDVIQEYGSFVDFDALRFVLAYANEKDSENLAEITECDYVPACALIARRSLIEEIGLIPEENFIYYDDIFWGIRCKRAGYKVAAYSKAVAWHKGGGALNPTTFAHYYLVRNKTRFFMANSDFFTQGDKDKRDETLAKTMMKEVFEGIYACAINGMPCIAKTRFDAFLDALNGDIGRAALERIREKEDSRARLYSLVAGKKTILIYTHDCFHSTRQILRDIRLFEMRENVKFQVELVGNADSDVKAVHGIALRQKPQYIESEYDLIINICNHVFYLKEYINGQIWIDGWANVVADEEDAKRFAGFEDSYKVFELCFLDRVVKSIGRLNSEEISKYKTVV